MFYILRMNLSHKIEERLSKETLTRRLAARKEAEENLKKMIEDDMRG